MAVSNRPVRVSLSYSDAREIPTTGLWGGATDLYRVFDTHGCLLYIGVTMRLLRDRFNAHSRSKEWWADVCWVELERYPKLHLALAAERSAIKSERPIYNIRSAVA